MSGAILAPTGKLRAAINLGNALLAGRDAAGGLEGPTVELARALAAELGVGIELVPFDGAAASVAAVRSGRVDLGFFAVDPGRSEGLRFTKPYLLIEGSYLVRASSPIHRNEEVDREGNRVVVGAGSAYDLRLGRELRHAAIVRCPSTPAVVGTFLAGGYEVAAGIRRQLELDAARLGAGAGGEDLRVLDGNFMLIEQAMAIPADRGEEAAAFLEAFLSKAKASGLLQACLDRHGLAATAAD